MIDPELAALVDLMPTFDLNDPVAARAAFEELIAGIAMEVPEAETLEIEDRLVPGWEGDPEVPVRVYRPGGPAATVRDRPRASCSSTAVGSSSGASRRSTSVRY